MQSSAPRPTATVHLRHGSLARSTSLTILSDQSDDSQHFQRQPTPPKRQYATNNPLFSSPSHQTEACVQGFDRQAGAGPCQVAREPVLVRHTPVLRDRGKYAGEVEHKDQQAHSRRQQDGGLSGGSRSHGDELTLGKKGSPGDPFKKLRICLGGSLRLLPGKGNGGESLLSHCQRGSRTIGSFQ